MFEVSILSVSFLQSWVSSTLFIVNQIKVFVHVIHTNFIFFLISFSFCLFLFPRSVCLFGGNNHICNILNRKIITSWRSTISENADINIFQVEWIHVDKLVQIHSIHKLPKHWQQYLHFSSSRSSPCKIKSAHLI